VNVLGKLSQTVPAYVHTEKRSNKIIQSDNSTFLKSKNPICNECNSSRTQPFDFAWERLSAWLNQNAPSLERQNFFRATSAFPYETRQCLLEVHLYFVKLFGGQLVDASANIDLSTYRQSILQQTANPNFYIAIGASRPERIVIERGDLEVWENDGRVACARNIVVLGNIAVMMCHAEKGHEPKYIETFWHPRHNTSKFKVQRRWSDSAD
jgi:hypothetical protein